MTSGHAFRGALGTLSNLEDVCDLSCDQPSRLCKLICLNVRTKPKLIGAIRCFAKHCDCAS